MNSILTPILIMVSWSLFMWLWMYMTRLPAMTKADVDPQDAAHPGSLNVLPSNVRRIADNYNHLHEQPTIFYALVIYCHLAGITDSTTVMLAWGYVGARVVHSIVQSTFNKVMIRFLLFVLSNVFLFAVAIRALLAL